MTLEKAMDILTKIDHADAWELFSEDIDAIRLGFEALKRISAARPYIRNPKDRLLPGETKE